MKLDEAGAQLMAFAVSNHYWYQLFIDELPIWGMVGEVVAEEDVIREIESHTEQPHGIADATFLYTHKTFTIAYNGPRIIEVNMTSDAAQPIQAGKDYPLTYSVQYVQAALSRDCGSRCVHTGPRMQCTVVTAVINRLPFFRSLRLTCSLSRRWVETDRPFEQRFTRYLDNNFFEHQIHWFSLFNSFMMVMFLCGLVALILMRTLKKDYARYMRDEEEGDGALDKGVGDDSGWKQVNADVFRRPNHLVLFTALVGTGCQLALLAVVVVLAAFAGSLYVDRGAVTRAAVFGYALTSVVSGYISGRMYRSYYAPEQSPNWIQVMLLSACLFPGLIFGVILTLNFIAMAYQTSNVLSFLTILKIFVLWAFVSLPLTIGGTILGRRFSAPQAPPMRVNPVPRFIPERPWYASSWVRLSLLQIIARTLNSVRHFRVHRMLRGWWSFASTTDFASSRATPRWFRAVCSLCAWLVAPCPSAPSSSRRTLYSPRSGTISSTTCMASCWRCTSS